MSFRSLWRRRRRQLKLAAVGALLPPVLVVCSNLFILVQSRTRLYDSIAAIPRRDVGLVLGSREGTCYFRYRVEAAAALYHAGKVKHLLVSGDNHTRSYDEATNMRDALIRRGVPAEDITRDFAGFRTLDSVVRARAVFGTLSVIIVSQEFHNSRAVFLARQTGIDAVAFNAQNAPARYHRITAVREWAARAVAFLDACVWARQPRFLGAAEPIGLPAPPHPAKPAEAPGHSS